MKGSSSGTMSGMSQPTAGPELREPATGSRRGRHLAPQPHVRDRVAPVKQAVVVAEVEDGKRRKLGAPEGPDHPGVLLVVHRRKGAIAVVERRDHHLPNV